MTALLLTLLLAVDPQVATAHTPHYDIRAVGMDADETALLLEQLHTHLTAFFGRSPQECLEVELFADGTAYRKALARVGQPQQTSGGYYSRRTKTVYLFVQPSEYYTRQLLLHEATHQFHLLAMTENRVPPTTWYVEGLAEYFGMHNWDGSRLLVGVVPAISLEDYPAEALRWIDAARGDITVAIPGNAQVTRPVAWSFVHFLVNSHPNQFRRMAAQLDIRGDSRTAWEEDFGSSRSTLTAEYRDWLTQHQQPWTSVWNQWQACGETLVGHSDVVAIAILKKTPDRIAVSMEAVEGALKAGLVFGYLSPDDFAMMQVNAAGRVWIGRRRASRWQAIETHSLGERGPEIEVSLVRDDDQVSLAVDGQTLGAFPSDGQIGLNVDGARVRFRLASSAAVQ